MFNKSNERSEVMLQQIIDLLPVRIFWKDMELKYLGCNKVFAQDAGKDKVEDLIGKDDFEMGWKDQAELYRADDMKVIESGESKIDYIEEQTTPDGKKIWLRTNKVPLKDGGGKIIGVLGTYIDITEEKLAGDKLKQSLEEVQKLNDLMVGREIQMVKLKEKIKELEEK